MSSIKFNEVKAKHIERLEQFVPIVERVHGEENPEFYEVRKLFDGLNEKIKLAGEKKANLNKVFVQLRATTNNYKIPSGVCESYEAVYNMLEEMDQAYHDEVN